MPDLSFLHASRFYEITAILALTSVVGFFGLLLRQPMVVSFIAVGVLSGPSGLKIVESLEQIELLAELGIAVLLFLVGLKLDVQLIRTLGAVSLATGLGQVVFTTAIGFLLSVLLGLDTVTSVYVSVALAFSSTIIIVKVLSDKKEVDSLYGRIAVGILIVQDLVVVLAMIALSAIRIGSQSSSGGVAWGQIGNVLLYATVFLFLVILFVRFLASSLVSRIAHSPELLIVFAMGWAAALAALGDHLGLSKELGGLLAGVSLASTPFREAIVARLASLRDFLLLFFFIALGAKLDLSLLGAQLIPAFVLSLFILIGKPLIVLVIMGFMGYRKRTSFLAGLVLAQISEFSLIFMAMGIDVGHVNAQSLGLVTLVGLITIALSVYMITYSDKLYRLFSPFVGVFEKAVSAREEVGDRPSLEKKAYDVILFGMGRYGSVMAQQMCKDRLRILAVDFNPTEVRRWRGLGYDVVYGDASDQEFILNLPLNEAKWVISAMPSHDLGLTHDDPRLILLDGLKKERFAGKIAMSAHHPHEIQALHSKGVHEVFLPFHDAAERAVERIKGAQKT